jgi:hypothetical protein
MKLSTHPAARLPLPSPVLTSRKRHTRRAWLCTCTHDWHPEDHRLPTAPLSRPP